MNDVLQTAQWMLALGLLPYALAVLMPSWRWLLGCVLLIGGPLALLWIQHAIAIATPGYNEGPGGAIGVGIFLGITFAFGIGVIVRAVTLGLVAKGLSPRHAFTINTAAFAIVVAWPAGSMAWEKWRLRSPSEACTRSVFDIEIVQARLALPAAPVFQVYLGQNSGNDAYYFWSAPSLRAFCSITADGTKRARAKNLALNFEEAWRFQRNICAEADRVPGWAVQLCTAMRSAPRRLLDDTDFPLKAYIFSPAEFRLGDFLGMPSTYEVSLGGPRPHRNETFLKTDMATPDGNPLTFACSPQSDGSSWCVASYRWHAGAHLQYVFRTSPQEIEDKGRRINTTLQAFLAPMRM
jgi:hypothetical protein